MDKLSLYDKILFPVVTEKSTNLSEQNKIVFKVPQSANKKTLKGSIEKLFLLFIKDIHKLPEQWKYFNGQILSELSQKEKFRVIADYIAGMTDNYLKREYDKFYT
jgi:ribosomal protein L23